MSYLAGVSLGIVSGIIAQTMPNADWLSGPILLAAAGLIAVFLADLYDSVSN